MDGCHRCVRLRLRGIACPASYLINGDSDRFDELTIAGARSPHAAMCDPSASRCCTRRLPDSTTYTVSVERDRHPAEGAAEIVGIAQEVEFARSVAGPPPTPNDHTIGVEHDHFIVTRVDDIRLAIRVEVDVSGIVQSHDPSRSLKTTLSSTSS